MTDVHRLPIWLGEVIRKLCASWNTRVVATQPRSQGFSLKMWVEREKTLKYGPMMWELKQRYDGYRVEQYKVIIDVLGGYS